MQRHGHPALPCHPHHRCAVPGLLALVIAVAPFVVAMPAAYAVVGLIVTPTFTPIATVGQSGLPTTIQVLNASTAPESSGVMTITAIDLVPACGTMLPVGSGDCPLAQADPGVFSVSPSGIGEPGTACAGQTFTVSTIDPATGQVAFTPSGGPLVLTQPGSPGSVCRIDFVVNVLTMPLRPASTPTANTAVTDQIGFTAGTSAVTGGTGTGFGSSSVTVAKTSPGISTVTTASAPVGTPISDTATLSAASPPGPPPTGTITFNLYLNDAACTSLAVFTATVGVTSGAGVYTSAPFTPASPGTYRWVATYNGDANNNPAAGACGAVNETVTVTNSFAMFSFPTAGATNVDTTLPFTWTPAASGAQGYYLTVGATLGGFNLVNSGTLPTTQTSYNVPQLPPGITVFARIYTEIGGNFSHFQDISFTAGPGLATFTNPTRLSNVDTTVPFTWTNGGAGVQGYYLTIGTSVGGSTLVNSGTLPATQTSYNVSLLPTGTTLFARISTKVNGNFRRFQDITFTAAEGEALFTNPTQGATGVTAPTATFTWAPAAGAGVQGYYLTVGTTLGGSDVVDSGTLGPSVTSKQATDLPAGTTLFARIYTEVGGNFRRFQDITFSTGG